MAMLYVLDEGICDMFNFLVAEPADFVLLRQAYMYEPPRDKTNKM